MVYQFLENKEKFDLEKLDKQTLVNNYLYLQDIYNKLEDDFALNLIEDL
jgi:hypothetical protein